MRGIAARLAKGVRGGGGRGSPSPRGARYLKVPRMTSRTTLHSTRRLPSWADLGTLRVAAAHEGRIERKSEAFRHLTCRGRFRRLRYLRLFVVFVVSVVVVAFVAVVVFVAFVVVAVIFVFVVYVVCVVFVIFVAFVALSLLSVSSSSSSLLSSASSSSSSSGHLGRSSAVLMRKRRDSQNA